jgi:hypothetical protein
MYCDFCGKELVPTEENEPYYWVNVESYLYCLVVLICNGGSNNSTSNVS